MQMLQINDTLVGLMRRTRGPSDQLPIKGTYFVEHVRDGKVLARFPVPNGITNVTKNDLLNVYFNRAVQQSLWSIGLIDNNGFTALAATDTSSSHSGWVEFTGYTNGSNSSVYRNSWGQGTASGQLLTNGAAAVYTFTAAGTVNGIFVISDQTKGGTVGILWSTASFGAPLAVLVGDVLNVTYSVQL